MNNTNLSNISTQINNDDLTKKGYIIFKQAIKNPEIYLKKLEKDPQIHSRVLWDIRLKTKKYFSQVWNDSNLACSFDTYRLGESHEIGWHIDQNQSRGYDRSCVQGVLALKKSNSTNLLIGSHLHFEELSRRITDNKNNIWEFYPIEDDDPIWNKKLKIEIPVLEPGDLLIFDSRLVHSASYCQDRAVVFVSMVPHKMIDPKIKIKRKRGFLKAHQTTHWCDRYILVEEDGPIRKKIPKKYQSMISDI
jgi:hypothetical protein